MPLIEFLRLNRDVSNEEDVPLPQMEGERQWAWTAMLTFLGLRDVLCPQTTVLRGIHHDVKVADLRGWTLFFSQPYSHVTSIEDFTPPAGTPGNALLVGARRAGSDTLTLAAMGHAEVVTAENPSSSPRRHNGLWWYCERGRSMGFTPNTDAGWLNDLSYAASTSRLGWSLNGFGGIRAGALGQLNDSTEWEKVIFVGHARLAVGEVRGPA